MNIIISGAAFSGNKGASGMATALIRQLQQCRQDAVCQVFSYYSKTDRTHREAAGIPILDGSPKNVCLLFFVFVVVRLCRILHLPFRSKCPTIKAILECDLWINAAGISFVDGREKFLIFNLLTIFPAICAGKRIVKAPQAMGPFNRRFNRIVAKWTLPKLELIAARGFQTHAYLDELGLTNICDCSDIAFSLNCPQSDRATAARLLPVDRGVGVIGISPSQVVDSLCRKLGIDYIGVLKSCVEHYLAAGFRVVVFPHSARAGIAKTHNNDLPLLTRFAAFLPDHDRLTVLNGEWSAGELRMLIAGFDVLIASRFHAIVSAMAVGVPAVVIGWSHKYAEVLARLNRNVS